MGWEIKIRLFIIGYRYHFAWRDISINLVQVGDINDLNGAEIIEDGGCVRLGLSGEVGRDCCGCNREWLLCRWLSSC